MADDLKEALRQNKMLRCAAEVQAEFLARLLRRVGGEDWVREYEQALDQRAVELGLMEERGAMKNG
jgi:hypothetical protein